MAEVQALLAATAARLAAGGARDLALAEFVPARRVLLVPVAAKLRPLGRVWRLGVLLLDVQGGVRATGRVTRAVPPGHPGHVAVSQEQRREVRAAAFRGPFAAGDTIAYDTTPIDLGALEGATGPLFTRDGRPLVRWSISAGDDAARDLEPYLREQADLLLHPPLGAT